MKGTEEEMKYTEAGVLEGELASGAFDCILLDFDHTLYLDNSTERFLDSVRPRILAYLLCAFSDWLLQVLAWFRLCSYPVHRDFVRVSLCMLLMPWSLPLWRKKAQHLAGASMNQWLLERLPADRRTAVISFGFAPLIRPLLDAAGLARVDLIASTPFRFSGNLRRSGKAAALQMILPEEAWEKTLFITDSRDDAELLDALPHGRLIGWGDSSKAAFHGLYLPFRYTVEGKYAGSRYFTYQILLEDLMLLLLAYMFSWQHAGALTALFASLYCIYEIGYYENDHDAVRREEKPVVSDAAAVFPKFPRFRPWLWAFGFAVIGFLFLYGGGDASAPLWGSAALLWAVILLSLRLLFLCFNYLAPGFRVPFFPLLHLYKCFAFACFVPLSLFGVLLLSAQVLAVSANYTAYRWISPGLRLNRQLWRLIIFLLLSAAVFMWYPMEGQAPSLCWWLLVLIWGGIRSLEHACHKNIVRIVGGLLVPALR